MKIVLWGFSSPKFIESVAAEFRQTLPAADLVVQIPEKARSVDYCGVQPEEFLRVDEGSFEQLKGIISRFQKHECVLVLDIWSLILLPDFIYFLSEVVVFTKQLKSVVFLTPEAWPSVWRQSFARVGAADSGVSAVLFERLLKALEIIMNEPGPFLLLQSPPVLEHIVNFTGREGLLALRKFGFDRAPRGVLLESARFCSRQSLGAALVQRLTSSLGSAHKPGWRHRIRGDVELTPERLLKLEEKEWASLAKLTQLAISWETYCAAEIFPSGHFLAEKNEIMKPSAYAAWLFLLAILEQDLTGQGGKRDPIEAAFVAASN